MPFLCHHRWSKSEQLCYFVRSPWKTALSFPSLYKNTTGCLLLWPRWTSSICFWLPSWGWSPQDVWQFKSEGFCFRLIFFFLMNVAAKRNTLSCEEIVPVIPFAGFPSWPVSLICGPVHLHQDPPRCHGRLGLLLGCPSSVARPPSPSEWSRMECSTVLLT